jgi:O-antigen/teichoic acid export membrane protein
MALFPRVAGAQDRRTVHREAVRGGLLLLALMSVLLGGIFAIAPAAVEVVLGPQYLASVGVLRVYLPGLLIASLNQPMAIFLQAEGAERFVARIVAPASFAGLAAIALGAALEGASGAAFGFLVMQVIVATFLAMRSMSILRENSPRPTPQIAERVKTVERAV